MLLSKIRSPHRMKNFTLYPKILLRSPALSFENAFSTLASLSKENQTATLQNLFQQKHLKEAIWLASPVLYRKCEQWLAGEITDKKDQKRIEKSLVRYWLRMSTRCTPFGLFAGCYLGEWGKKTEIVLADNDKNQRLTRLDMNYLCALAQHLTNHAELQPHLRFFPNSSIYKFGDSLRFVEYQYKNGQRLHNISAVDSSEYLQAILAAAKGGAHLTDLANLLVDDDISVEDALGFLAEVVSSQLLVSDLEPALTGDGILHQILETLANTPFLKGAAEPNFFKNLYHHLKNIQTHLDNLDNGNTGENFPIYLKIQAAIEQLNVPFQEGKLFQVDSVKTVEKCTLKYQIAGELRKAITVLNKLTARKPKTKLEEFKAAFRKRYEDAEIPLLQVLDTESGIGYHQNDLPGDNSQLTEDIPFSGKPAPRKISWGTLDSFLFKKYQASRENDSFELEITDAELSDFNMQENDLPAALSVLVELCGTTEKNNNRPLIFMNTASGYNAVKLAGRFTHASAEIYDYTVEAAKIEQEFYPDAAVAEIIHLPESRTGNILLRKPLQTYEIPFLAKSSLPAEQQIDLQDLTISVRQGHLFLKSKKLQKEVIPRLGNAHNFMRSNLPVYQFLCDVQFQKTQNHLHFHWGEIEKNATFLPRVRYRNVILSKAFWLFSKEELTVVLNKKKGNLVAQFQAFKNQWQLPRYVVLAESDNELLLDLEQELCLEILQDYLKTRPRILIKEFLFDPKHAVVKDENGQGFTHQFVSTFFQNNKMGITPKTTTKSPSSSIQKSFHVGSEWLYFKFYCGTKAVDKLLLESIYPAVELLLQKGLIDQWFFLRFADPDWHFRIRFHLPNPEKIGDVLAIIYQKNQPFIKENYLWKTQLDTYQRELKRYGSTSMEASEKLFWVDSQLVLNFLKTAITYGENEELRWAFGLFAIDELLTEFQLTLPQKMNLLEQMKTNFAKEFNAETGAAAKAISRKYRQYRTEIEAVIAGKKIDEEVFPTVFFDLIKQRNETQKEVIQQILNLEKTGKLAVRLPDLLSSYLHMHLNRLLPARQRSHEVILYDFLYRAYRSVWARNKGSK